MKVTLRNYLAVQTRVGDWQEYYDLQRLPYDDPVGAGIDCPPSGRINYINYHLPQRSFVMQLWF